MTLACHRRIYARPPAKPKRCIRNVADVKITMADPSNSMNGPTLTPRARTLITGNSELAGRIRAHEWLWARSAQSVRNIVEFQGTVQQRSFVAVRIYFIGLSIEPDIAIKV
jgi:hypothetical protein